MTPLRAIFLILPLTIASQAFGYGLSPDFGTNGIASIAVAQGARDVLVQPDGKIVVAGTAADGTVVVARRETDGSPDAGFGTGGTVATPDIKHALGIGRQSDGKIVVAAESAPFGGDFAVARYDEDGTLDASFGTAGIVLTDFGGTLDLANALVIQADQKIVVAGKSNGRLALARYATDGALDASFGAGGLVATPTTANTDVAFRVGLQSDGKIVAAGYSDDGDNRTRMLIARYTIDGALDPSFGDGGRVLASVGNYAGAWGMAIQPDDKIVVAGAGGTAIVRPNAFVTLRFDADGGIDPTFGRGKPVLTDFGQQAGAYALALRADGGPAGKRRSPRPACMPTTRRASRPRRMTSAGDLR